MTEILVKKRGRPKKQLLEKKEPPQKNIQENWTDDFVFPIFSETKKSINQKPSPYILDLKHQQEKKEVKNLPAAPVFPATSGSSRSELSRTLLCHEDRELHQVW